MSRSEGGAAVVMSNRRPNRIVVGLVLLIGLTLAWYWMRHDLLSIELSDRAHVLPAAAPSSPLHTRA
jgi:hypothetical protein